MNAQPKSPETSAATDATDEADATGPFSVKLRAQYGEASLVGFGLLVILGWIVATMITTRPWPMYVLWAVAIGLTVWRVYVYARVLFGRGGVLALGTGGVTLPPAPHLLAEASTPFEQVKFAYMLDAGDTLVIETRARAFVYPARCFADRNDIRRLLRALNHPPATASE